jgi:starch synthase
MNRFLFVSAENDSLHGCKAGGMGDVVRDVPREIASRGDQVGVVVPSYGRLHQGGTLLQTLQVPLRDSVYEMEVYRVSGKKDIKGLTHYVLHHPEIQAGDIAHMYHHDPEEPFHTDFVKFSIFCSGVAEGIRQEVFGPLQTVHLHDWHSSLLLVLREFDPRYEALRSLRFIFSIHNLAIQGIRPLTGHYSSLSYWFPKLHYKPEALTDPRYQDCINLMAVGIRLSDAVHTVSPSYMLDILKPSRPPEFIGGEGLEKDLQQARDEDRLFGILNGCDYQQIQEVRSGGLYRQIIKALFGWLQEESKKYKADFLAHTGEKVLPLLDNPPKIVCSSVARLTEQKFYFFKHDPASFRRILEQLEEVGGIFMLLGTGAPEYEEHFRDMSHQYKNFIFTNGQSENLINSIYLETDLYLMPSLFEPCGISQMLAMRNGNPVLAHATGGLKDTIQDQVTGFLFGGDTYEEAMQDLDRVFSQALDVFFNHPKQWAQMRDAARQTRFTWTDSVSEYYRDLYNLKP